MCSSLPFCLSLSHSLINCLLFPFFLVNSWWWHSDLLCLSCIMLKRLSSTSYLFIYHSAVNMIGSTESWFFFLCSLCKNEQLFWFFFPLHVIYSLLFSTSTNNGTLKSIRIYIKQEQFLQTSRRNTGVTRARRAPGTFLADSWKPWLSNGGL